MLLESSWNRGLAIPFVLSASVFRRIFFVSKHGQCVHPSFTAHALPRLALRCSFLTCIVLRFERTGASRNGHPQCERRAGLLASGLLDATPPRGL